MNAEAMIAAGAQKVDLLDALTPQQRRVFDKLILGWSNLRIARSLSLSEKTVKAHVTALLEVFKCESRAELIVAHYGRRTTPDDWETLRELIAAYAEAYVADSWKGGGDPTAIPVIEMHLKEASEALDAHITKMERGQS